LGSNSLFAAPRSKVWFGPDHVEKDDYGSKLCKGHYLRKDAVDAVRSESPVSAQMVGEVEITLDGSKLSICLVVAKDEKTGCCFNLGAILF
jgi:hypothetical protein